MDAFTSDDPTRFDKELAALLSREAKRPLSASELVEKGRLIQLSSVEDGPQLPEALHSFLLALDLDEEYVPAHLELGWYFYAVDTDIEEALRCFRRAFDLLRHQTTEAVSGIAGCVDELMSEETAREEYTRLTARSAMIKRAKLSPDLREWFPEEGD